MSYYSKSLSILLLFVSTIIAAQNKVTLSGDLGKHTIDKHIYGHFAEHLGR